MQRADLEKHTIPAGATDDSLLWLRLDNVPVMGRLAVITRQCQGKNLRVGQEVVERLLLDGIDLHDSRLSITKVIKPPANVLADETETCQPLADLAVARAEIAMQLPVGRSFSPTCFMKLRADCRNAHSVDPIDISSPLGPGVNQPDSQPRCAENGGHPSGNGVNLSVAERMSHWRVR